jgi:hypothetical protein
LTFSWPAKSETLARNPVIWPGQKALAVETADAVTAVITIFRFIDTIKYKNNV